MRGTMKREKLVAMVAILISAMMFTMMPAMAFAAGDANNGVKLAASGGAGNADVTAGGVKLAASGAESTATGDARDANAGRPSGGAAAYAGYTLQNPSIHKDGNRDVVSNWDCIYFGEYLQSANKDEGGYIQEPIKWRILQLSDTDGDGVDDDAFLMADKLLYRTKYSGTTWENSYIRSWLNGYGADKNMTGVDCSSDAGAGASFINTAFNDAEKAAVKTTDVVNGKESNPFEKEIDCGPDTEDKVFLFSMPEIANKAYGFLNNYTMESVTRRAQATDYARSIAGPDEDYDDYWLRPQAYMYDNSKVVTVLDTGRTTFIEGVSCNNVYGVRPALHMDITRTDLWSYAGVVDAEGNEYECRITGMELPSEETYTFTGGEIEPSPIKVYCGTEPVGRDICDISFSDNYSAGTASVTANATAKGYLFGTITKTFEIQPFDISQDSSIVSVKIKPTTYDYTGEEIRPDVSLMYAEQNFTQGVDYTVDYRNNIESGEATAIVRGIGNFCGSREVNFTIRPRITEVTFDEQSYEYTGSEIEPKPIVKFRDKVLTEDRDYRITEYSNNVNAGTATVKIMGIGDYSYQGYVTGNFEIAPLDISRADITLSADTAPYTGDPIRPTPTVTMKTDKMDETTLVEGTDYTVKYRDNVCAGEATVVITCKGNYTGKATKSFTIETVAITDAEFIKATEPADFWLYTSKPITPKLKVMAGDMVLDNHVDYTVEYANNTDVGTATATITGIGSCTGTITKEFKIASSDMGDATAILSYTQIAYNGTERTPAVAVMLNGVALAEGTDYTVEYGNNRNVGSATVTIRGTGSYRGKTVKTFKINPKGTVLKPATRMSASFYAKWLVQGEEMADSRVTGYQLRYSTKKSMAGAKLKTVKGYRKTVVKITKLKANRKYYMQVRTYKVIDGKKYYSKWSAKKYVTTA